MIYKFASFLRKLSNYKGKQMTFSEAIATEQQENKPLTWSNDWMFYNRFFEVILDGSFCA